MRFGEEVVTHLFGLHLIDRTIIRRYVVITLAYVQAMNLGVQ